MQKITRAELWISIVVVLGMGVIHLVLAPQEFEETPYVGILFVAHSLAALIAAIGIYRGARIWGWGLGLFIAAGAVIGYVISRTVGLPGMEIEEWFQPLGMLALVLELSFVVLYLRRRPFGRGIAN
jgi:hypothetical protein